MGGNEWSRGVGDEIVMVRFYCTVVLLYIRPPIRYYCPLILLLFVRVRDIVGLMG